MSAFVSIYGIVTMISDFWTGSDAASGCYKLMTVQNTDGNVVNFVITPTTYFVYHTIISVGDPVIGFYDANVPVPLIYPPQYHAIVMARFTQDQNIKVDFFDSQLVSSDGTLKLTIGPATQIIQENGQPYTANPANKNLIAVYGASTRSIPAQTVPYMIVVMCPLTS
ncbi:hypothetical protein SAMN02745823_03084 [Sporobacter termitidis DSM 10068]|uniref:Uncharacterized protein n=1 Tax=Sporobacter termitidis DSM 10068 TaxID=1123282 RepID=A0A1M5Z170_9FIRM|nr:hypothetical protein [Sporobacter termitidis]SHI18025.1 hypothetical protein SAMN02745823_03084 [Sporobacter termitidis DSM 10068]